MSNAESPHIKLSVPVCKINPNAGVEAFHGVSWFDIYRASLHTYFVQSFTLVFTEPALWYTIAWYGIVSHVCIDIGST